MGIPKLTAYMRNYGHFTRVILKKFASKLVIDGFSLCYALHCGIVCGDYKEFYQEIVKFFEGLKCIGVEAYVVVDGIDYENKKEVSNDRNRLTGRLKLLQRKEYQRDQLVGCESFLPSLAKVVFIDALRENDIKFFVADGEADRDIASLANHLQCPVLSNDSDFFVFNIECGFIFMPDNPEDVFKDEKLEFFEYQAFMRRCNFYNLQARLFLPYCLGNDFHGRHKLEELQINIDDKVSVVVKKLGTRSLPIENYQQELDSYCKFYDVTPQSFDYLSDPCNSKLYSQFIPLFIVSNFKKGMLFRNAMSLLVNKVWNYVLLFENLENESAWKVSGSVLMFVIGALLSCYKRDTISSVRVVTRLPILALECVDILIDSLKQHHFDTLKEHSLSTICGIPKFERQKIVLRVFHCKHVSLENVPEDLKLAVIASRCWMNVVFEESDKPFFNAFVVALVLCFQTHFESDHLLNIKSDPKQTHCLAQWEGMLYLANIFNQILDFPFPYASLGRLFSVTQFQKFLEKPTCLTPSVDLDESGKIMYNVIVEDFLPETGPLPGQLVSQFFSRNRFAPLST